MSRNSGKLDQPLHQRGQFSINIFIFFFFSISEIIDSIRFGFTCRLYVYQLVKSSCVFYIKIVILVMSEVIKDYYLWSWAKPIWRCKLRMKLYWFKGLWVGRWWIASWLCGIRSTLRIGSTSFKCCGQCHRTNRLVRDKQFDSVLFIFFVIYFLK